MDLNECITLNVESEDSLQKVVKKWDSRSARTTKNGVRRKTVTGKYVLKQSTNKLGNNKDISQEDIAEHTLGSSADSVPSCRPHFSVGIKGKKFKGVKRKSDIDKRGCGHETAKGSIAIPDVIAHNHTLKPVEDILFSTEEFKDLPIHPFSTSNLTQNMNITKLTTVQKKAIPALLSGADVLIRSQTGSGKTLAYALPIIEALQKIRPKLSRKDGVHALIVVPTRELALQTYEVFVKLLKPFMWIVPGCLMGGEKRKSEKARLRKGVTVLVGTPGRLLDHAKSTRALRFDRTMWLVVDEADRLFELGYERDINALLQLLDEHRQEYELCYGAGHEARLRQSVLLSATLTPAVKNLSNLALKEPCLIETTEESGSEEMNSSIITLPSTLSQYYVITPAKLRLIGLIAFIVWKCQFSEEKKIIVFCGTQDMVDFHTDIFSVVLNDVSIDNYNMHSEDDLSDGDERKHVRKKVKIKKPIFTDEDEVAGLADMDIFRLHGNMSQQERTEVFKTFRSAPCGVLFCTDVASRGLDLTLVDWVVQLSPPQSVPHYAHRVGRAARVGAEGSALLFLVDTEVEFIATLQESRISLHEHETSTYLQYLKMAVDASPKWKTELKNYGKTPEDLAVALQHSLEDTVSKDEKLKQKACKAYTSWMRFYSSYPKEVRSIFNMKRVHPGHFASSFALSLPPSAIVRCSKGLPTPEFVRKPKKPPTPFKRSQQQSSTVSEYDSGLPSLKKRRKT